MVLGTVQTRQRQNTCESEHGFGARTRALYGRRGVFAIYSACVCLLAFASLQHVSGDRLNVLHDKVSHQASSHRALVGVEAISPLLQTDLVTLLNWKQHWISVPGQNPNVTLFFDGWNGSSPCGWQGIVCWSSGPEATTRVTQVNLASVGIVGPLPESGYANLSACTSLTISFNQINGSIPVDIANMTSLQFLDLSMNEIGGGIPPQFEGAFIDQLVSLNISSNNFSGPILPTMFSSCGSLQALNLSINSFSGNVVDVSRCASLTLIDVWQNDFTGSVPALGQLPLLQYVTLSENPIGGPLPPEFFANCGNMISFQMARMQLSGAIPDEIGSCHNLQVFNVQGNNLTGALPPSLGNLSQLNTLGVGSNGFSGPLPAELGNLASLQSVDFTQNQFSGVVPASFINLTNLLDLALQQNLLVGTFPLQLTTLKNLRLLDLSNNQFMGPIPQQLSLCTGLEQLLLAYNNFSGPMPVELGTLSSLQVLDLSYNEISGSIPPQLGNLKSLLWLQLSNNQLTGAIPPELGGCSSLIWLNLFDNQLTGPIPDTFVNIGQSALQTFIANRNKIPLVVIDLGECGALERWLPSLYEPFSFLVEVLAQQSRICRQQWNLLLKGQLHPADLATPLGYMQLSFNHLSGQIPKSIGVGGSFSILFLDNNHLTGPIPDTLDQMPLYNLNLSHNSLTGPIPESLGSAQHLLSIDLSFNNLTGPIPPALEDLTFMDTFNVSYNNFTGPVPIGNQFATYPPSSYIGNPYLCSSGNPYSGGGSGGEAGILQQCGMHGPHSITNGIVKSKKLTPKQIIGITLGCTAAALFAAGCLCLICASRRPKHAGSIEQVNAATDSRFTKVGRDQWFHSTRDMLKIPVSAFGPDVLPKALAYRDLLMATANFDDSNVIGDGGFGVVYKAKLSDGSVVAIKKLHQDGAQGEREFAAEMLTLGNIHHENLVPLLGYCASEREKLLVYKCMTNGSLEEWLHDRPGGKEILSWARRVNIAAGAARGVAFLHHSCSPVIIHRDMKASNILLDDNFGACVTDFGLARRMYGQDTHVSTIVAGTLGYVPPEYSQTWRSTTKGDVYSFGGVLLELITGRRPTGADFDDENGTYLGGNVVEWVRILLAKRRHEEAYCSFIKNQGASQELIQFLKLAVVCTEESPNNRPVMTDVAKALDQILLSINMRSPSGAFL